ncbi:MAG: DUF3368 domain-containing protein [SAR324 cluster bacterium]|nr:DUF3368 domain-containing protein [SAR324 cluster bacterium]
MEVVIDNTVLSNFALIQRVELLHKVFDGGATTSQHVWNELQIGEKQGVIPENDWSDIKVLELSSDLEKTTFERIKQKLGTGESACLSLAIHRNLKVLTDDLDARKYAQRRGIPVSGSIGVLILAIRKKLISLGGGNDLLLQMIQKGYYSPYQKLDGLI